MATAMFADIEQKALGACLHANIDFETGKKCFYSVKTGCQCEKLLGLQNFTRKHIICSTNWLLINKDHYGKKVAAGR